MKEMTPYKERGLTQRPWGRWFDDFLMPLGRWDPESEVAKFTPRIDVRDTPEAFVFTAEVPGIKPEDIQVSVQGDTLTISGEKRQESKQEEETWFRTERSYGSFMRQFSLPTAVDSEHVKAEVDDGVLTVSLMKIPETKPKQIKIKRG